MIGIPLVGLVVVVALLYWKFGRSAQLGLVIGAVLGLVGASSSIGESIRAWLLSFGS